MQSLKHRKDKRARLLREARDAMLARELKALGWAGKPVEGQPISRPCLYYLHAPGRPVLGPDTLEKLAPEARRIAALPAPKLTPVRRKPLGRRPRRSLDLLRRCVACTALVWLKDTRTHLSASKHFTLDEIANMSDADVQRYFPAPEDVDDDGTGDT